ncbi:MAG: HDOD domain-containing protein [FCB group bacterium]|nr:HDOD domain-containing protein [FCB group bacterium]
MTTQTITGIEAEINRLVGDVGSLPTPPIVFSQIQKVLTDPNTSAYDIGGILQEDPAISAKVLKMTNSAYYGLPRTIESVKQAVVIIGIEAIKNLVLSASVIDSFSKNKLDREFQDYFWRHSLATAFAARLLSRELSGQKVLDTESSFSAGLLHDIGKMVISVYLSDLAEKIKAEKIEKPYLTDRVVENEIMGFDHTHIGAYLGGHWKLPAKLVEAVRYHHDPVACENPENGLPHLIHLANYLALHTFDLNQEEGNKIAIDAVHGDVLEVVGLTEDDLLAYAPALRDEYLKAETFLEMARGAA